MVFSLRKKLYLSFLIIIVLFLITAIVSTFLSQRIVKLTHNILLSESRLEVVQRLNLFARTTNDNGAHFLLAPVYIEEDFKSRFETSIRYMHEELTKLSAITTEPKSLEQINNFKVKWMAYVVDSKNILSLKKDGLVAEAQERFTKDSFDPIAFSLHSFYVTEQSQIASFKTEIENSGKTIRTVNLITALFAILLSLLIAIILSNYLIRRIQLLKTSAQTVAKGDLQIPDLHFKGMDELTELANAFNSMTHALRSVIDSNQFLQQLSSRDGLTGIANRRSYDETLEREWERLSLVSKPISLILFDIDYFKKFNDLYGHQAGDTCLKQVASVLQEPVVGSGNFAARYGGEEFTVLLPDQTMEEAIQVAERILASLADKRIPHDGSEVSHLVTLSVGISTLTTTVSGQPGILLLQADQAMYEAKRNGRNQICSYDPGDENQSENRR